MVIEEKLVEWEVEMRDFEILLIFEGDRFDRRDGGVNGIMDRVFTFPLLLSRIGSVISPIIEFLTCVGFGELGEGRLIPFRFFLLGDLPVSSDSMNEVASKDV